MDGDLIQILEYTSGPNRYLLAIVPLGSLGDGSPIEPHIDHVHDALYRRRRHADRAWGGAHDFRSESSAFRPLRGLESDPRARDCDAPGSRTGSTGGVETVAGLRAGAARRSPRAPQSVSLSPALLSACSAATPARSAPDAAAQAEIVELVQSRRCEEALPLLAQARSNDPGDARLCPPRRRMPDPAEALRRRAGLPEGGPAARLRSCRISISTSASRTTTWTTSRRPRAPSRRHG